MKYVRVKDEFIGRSFGVGEHLTVVELGSMQGDKKLYKLYCSVCAQDPELFGDGVFEMTKGNILKGAIPCGCSANPRWNEQQSVIRVKRKLSGSQTSFVSLAEPYHGTETKLTLHCNKHNLTWSITNFHVLLGKKTKGMCIECEKEVISDRRTADEGSVIESIVATGAFPEGSTFWRTPLSKPKQFGHSAGYYWGMLCGVCSYDEYVDNGLCDGVFITNLTELQQGRRPCRCSKHFRWTLAQREYQIKRELDKSETPLNFVSFKYEKADIHKTGRLKFWAHCEKHSTYVGRVGEVGIKSLHCPECSTGGGFKVSRKGVVYVLKVQDTGGQCFTGFGISTDYKKRAADHNRNLERADMFISEERVFDFPGRTALAVENEIKKLFPCLPQDIKGFRKEATHSSLYDDVVSYVQSRHTSNNLLAA